MTKRYRSEAYAAIHETMEALNEIGAVDKQAMHEFSESCLMPLLAMSSEDDASTSICRKRSFPST